MTADRWQRIQDVFHAALEREPQGRAAFLEEACASDGELRQEVESLLAYRDRRGDLLEQPPFEDAMLLLAQGRRDALIGQMVSHYRVLAELGAGGMGEVYLAEDQKLGRKVALKLLPAAFTGDADRVRRFQQEARAASALDHPNIAAVYEIGHEDSLHFIAVEFIRGETLRQRIGGGRLAIREALEIAIQIASALAKAHQAGIVHRDIKPANIMLHDDGYVKLLDFGIALLAAEQESGGSRGGTPIGTAGYLSPEQARGEALDGRSDLFSLGVVLYEMIAGQKPFGVGAEAIQAVVHQEPAPLGVFRLNVPAALETIAKKALAKEREERYQSAGEMLRALDQLKTQLQSPVVHDARPAAIHRNRTPTRWLGRLLRRKRARIASASAAGGAFHGLGPFQEADRQRFFGREREASALYETISRRQCRFGVLYGDSGAGKTSLLMAGLLPKLRQDACLPVYCRSFKDPLAAALDQCRAASGVEPREAELSIDYLRRVAESQAKVIVIVCDQFEEFFVNCRTRREREPFAAFVAGCYNTADLPVKFLFSIRSDFLYLIGAEFDGRIPEPLMADKRYHLRNFDQEQAEEIIRKSARRADLDLDDDLCRHVAHDLAVGERVLPSELQIVGEQLQNKGILTTEQYRRAGGKEQLVHSYLDDVIEAAPDRNAARLLLRSLISQDNTRVALTLREIARRAQCGRGTVEETLGLFAGSRLIHEIQDEEPWRYELTHEYLIEGINRTSGRVMDATQRANRQFRQFLSSYALDRRTHIPIIRLWFIRRYSDLERGDRERELLRKSLRTGMLRLGLSTLLASVLVISVAAWSSLREEWEGVRLADGHTAGVRRAVFSPDGRLLVSGGEDKKVIVWDFVHRLRLASLTGHTGSVSALAYSPDGKWFATGGYDHRVIVWDALNLKPATVLTEHSAKVSGLSFSHDGHLLASASAPGRIILWNTRKWERIFELRTNARDEHIAILFSEDDRTLILSSGSAWDLSARKELTGFHEDWDGNWTALSPDDRCLVSVDATGSVKFVDLPGRRLIAQYKAHKDNGRAVAYSPDGRLVATGAENIVLWDAATRTKIVPLNYPSIVWSLAFSPDGKWLVSTHGDGSILVWNPAERELVANLSEHSGAVRSVAYSRDGRYIASGSEDDSVIVWDSERREKKAVLTGHQNKVEGVAFAPDGKSLVSTDFEGVTISWDLEQRRPQWISQARGASQCLAVSPNGRWLATGQTIYTAEDGKEVVSLNIGSWGTAFSPDSRWLITLDAGNFFIRDTQTWKAERYRGEPSLVVATFSSDGKFLATGGIDGAVRLWEFHPLREVAVLGRHANRVKSVAFSPDGKQVASAGDDREIKLWDVARRRLVTTIGTHPDPVLSIAFSPDGMHLVSGEHDKSVRLFTRHRSVWGRRLD